MRLYMIAMHDEASEIIKDFKRVTESLVELYVKDDIFVAISQVGKVNASFALTYLLTKYPNIDKIINIGFAGAVGNYDVGDNVLVSETIYHDFDLTVFNYKLGEVPNIKEDFITSESYLRLFYDFKHTILYTGDSFQTNALNDDYLADMEGSALYHVAHLFNKPIFSIKVVSDVIGKDKVEDYEKFEKIGAKNIEMLYNTIEVRLKKI